MNKMVMGIGLNDNTRPSRINGVKTRAYIKWVNMLYRINPNGHVKELHPTYLDCDASDDFKVYSRFYDWYVKQIGADEEGFQLDKDLVFKGNKIYSAETCFLVPKRINTLILNRDNDRGELPIGVQYKHKQNKYQARVSDGRDRYSVGLFETPELAFEAYKEAKELLIQSYALEYKDKIHPKVFNALMNYSVDITD